jgi:thiamine-phosphate diphosphorylase
VMSKLSDELPRLLRVYVVTDSRLSQGRSTVDVVRAVVAGGARAIQLREKQWTDRQLLDTGREIRAITRRAGALFIVNDRVDLAMALEADGVHLGQDDMPIHIARKILGPSKIIGATVETEQEASFGEEQGADYVGTGPVFATNTKLDAGSPYGTALIKRIKGAVSLPVVAIGGISRDNICQVWKAGADGAAVVSAVVSQPDVSLAVSQLINSYELYKRRECGGMYDD